MPGEGFGINPEAMIFSMTITINPESLTAAFKNMQKCVFGLKQVQLDKANKEALTPPILASL